MDENKPIRHLPCRVEYTNTCQIKASGLLKHKYSLGLNFVGFSNSAMINNMVKNFVMDLISLIYSANEINEIQSMMNISASIHDSIT
jgi:hypothetical protein